jgi:hypothetical protein
MRVDSIISSSQNVTCQNTDNALKSLKPYVIFDVFSTELDRHLLTESQRQLNSQYNLKEGITYPRRLGKGEPQ